MNVLVDLNILLDFFQERDFYREAATLLDWNKSGKIQGFLCAHEISNLTYFLEKDPLLKSKVKKILSALMDEFEIVTLDKDLLTQALSHYRGDFEDDLLAQAFRKRNLDYLVTRDPRGFKHSEVRAVNPVQFLSLLDDE